MIGFLKRWLGNADRPDTPDPRVPAEPEDPDRRPPAVALASPSATAVPTQTHNLLHRETLVDRRQHLAGVAFSLPRKIHDRIAARVDTVRQSYDAALIRLMAGTALDALDTRPIYLQLSPLSLGDPGLDHLPAQRITLILDGPAEGQALQQQLARRRAQGWQIGWRLSRHLPAVVDGNAVQDLVQVDVAHFDGLQLKDLATRLKKLPVPPGTAVPPLIACSLQSDDDFQLCHQAGFDLFQGAFVLARENWQPPRSDIDRMRIFQLLNLIRSGAEAGDIADCLRTDPVITFKLLRYINSPALGLQKEITSIGQGLMALGREKFYRWLSLLLFDAKAPGYRERALTEQALVRARFMEALASEGAVSAQEEALFLTGLFSVIDGLLGRPLGEILVQVSLPEPTRQALLGEPGPIRTALDLTIALETGDVERGADLAEACGIADERLARCLVDALAWSQQVTRSSDAS